MDSGNFSINVKCKTQEEEGRRSEQVKYYLFERYWYKWSGDSENCERSKIADWESSRINPFWGLNQCIFLDYAFQYKIMQCNSVYQSLADYQSLFHNHNDKHDWLIPWKLCYPFKFLLERKYDMIWIAIWN